MKTLERLFKSKKLFLIVGSVVLSLSTLNASDVFADIEVLENKKMELFNQQNGGTDQEAEIRRRAAEEYKAASDKIDEELVRIAETDVDGRILSDVRKRRLEEKAQIKAEIDARADEEIKALKNGDPSKKQDVLNQIKELEEQLKQKRVISSFDQPKLLEIIGYAGDNYCWNIQSRFYIGDYFIYSQKFYADYEKISGKKPASITSSKSDVYNDYLDSVDYYDKLLKDGSISLEVEYYVEACPVNMPSTYKIIICDVRLVNTISNEILQKFTPNTTVYQFTVSPVVDLRKLDETKESAYSGNKTITSVKVEDSENSSTSNTATGNKTLSKYERKSDEDGRFVLGFNFGLFPIFYQTSAQFDPTFDIFSCSYQGFLTCPINSYVYFVMDCGLISCPNIFDNCYIIDGNIANCLFGLGVNKKIDFVFTKMDVFCDVACGFTYVDNLIPYAEDVDNLSLALKTSVGVDMEFGKIFVFSTSMDLYYLGQYGFCMITNFGVGINLY